MRFFRFTHPDYATDREFAVANPGISELDKQLPGIICEHCGQRWGSSSRIRIGDELSRSIDAYLLSIEDPDVVTVQEWERISKDLSHITGLPEETLEPGVEYGAPVGVLKRADIADILHPFPGTIWITARVAEALGNAELIGADFVPVRLKPVKRVAATPGNLPELWEIIITGKAWRRGMDLERITVCKVCKRTEFPEPEQLEVDESRWDGSDFFHLDLNPNIVLVTERVLDVLNQGQFSNFRCIPLG